MALDLVGSEGEARTPAYRGPTPIGHTIAGKVPLCSTDFLYGLGRIPKKGGAWGWGWGVRGISGSPVT